MANEISEEWGPLAPNEGPPLPRSLGIFWPWYKKEAAAQEAVEAAAQEIPQGISTAVPVTVISQPSVSVPAAPVSTSVQITQLTEEAAAKEVSAVEEKYTLYTDVIGEGRTIPTSGRSFSSGATVEITAVPSTGWVFDHWEGDAYGTSTVTRVSMDTDKEVVAVFAELETVVTETPTVEEPSLPEVTTVEVPDYPVIGMFGVPSLNMPSEVTLGDQLQGSVSIPTVWPSSLSVPTTIPTYPVNVKVLLVGSEYLIASRSTSFKPGSSITIPISYDTSGLPKEGSYNVKLQLTDGEGTKFIDSILGRLKVLAAALPEVEELTYKLTLDVDPADGSKGYAVAEPYMPGYIYPKGTVVKITATAMSPYKLDHWTVNGDYKAGGTGNYAMTLWPMAQDVTVKAFFK